MQAKQPDFILSNRLKDYKFQLSDTVSVSAKGFKSVQLTTADGQRISVLTSDISQVPRNWGVQVNEQGTTRMTLQTGDIDTKHLSDFQDRITELVIAKKKTFFPKVKGVTDDEIRNSRYDLVKPGNEKKSGGFWPSTMRLNIPDKINTGTCSIVSADSEPIENALDLNGATVKFVVFDISGLFFMGNRAAWGFSKKLKSVKVDVTSNSDNLSSIDITKFADSIRDSVSETTKLSDTIRNSVKKTPVAATLKRKVTELSQTKTTVEHEKTKKMKLRG